MSNKLYEFVSENEIEDNENYEYFYEDVVVDDNPASIQLCILSAINVGKVKSDEELEELCDLSVRGLDELIDYQKYPVKAAEIAWSKNFCITATTLIYPRLLDISQRRV